MADQSQMMKSHESQDEGGQAQARRTLDESVMMGKGCEPQDNMQRGMGHGDTMKDAAESNDAAKNSSPVGGGGGSGNINSNSNSNSNSNTYLYSNHSLI